MTTAYVEFEVVGIDTGVYQIERDGVKVAGPYFADNVAKVARWFAETIEQCMGGNPGADWVVCECGKVLDVGAKCDECDNNLHPQPAH